MGPIHLHPSIILGTVGHVPDRLDIQFLVLRLDLEALLVDLAVVQEKVNSSFSNMVRSSDLAQKVDVLLRVKAVVLDGVAQQAVARADCGYDRLAGLVACPVLDDDVLPRTSPSTLLVPSS